VAGGGTERHTHIKEGRKGRKGAERGREGEREREQKRKREKERGREAGRDGRRSLLQNIALFCEKRSLYV